LALIATSARLGGLSYRFGLPLAAQLGLPLPQSPIIGDSTLVLGATALSAFGTDPSLFMLRRAVEAMARCPAETRQAATAGMVGFDLADEIADITLPTLVLCGTRDLVLPFSHSERVAAAIPGAELIALPNAGHLVVWERPAELATHITRLVHQ
jgi:pimeloyl-ACP methyl ester carboxylesterase